MKTNIKGLLALATQAAWHAGVTEYSDSASSDDVKEARKRFDDARIAVNLEVERLVLIGESLAWIVTFCEEHEEWFGKGEADEGAEFEWLAEARVLLDRQ